jgi:chromosome segregation protein
LQKQGNVVRLEKLSAEKIQLEEERARLERRLQEFSQNVEADKLHAQASRGTVEQRQQRLRELQQELNQAGQVLDGLLQQQAALRSQLNVLEQLQEAHEGFSSGALAALKQSKSVLGSLADRIQVPAQYVTAVEAALGHHLQLVLTEKPEAAHQILSELSTQKKGRASVAPLAFPRGAGGPPASVDGHVSALAVVEAEASVQPLLNGLLGRTVIVENLAAATEAWQRGAGELDFVTHHGELLTRHGVFTGGSNNGNGKGAASILGRKNHIADLRKQLTALQSEINEASRRIGALQGEQTELQATLQQAQAELRSQEVAIATREGEFKALENSLRVLHQKIDTVVYEIQSLADHDREGAARRQGLANELAQHEERERGLQAELAELNSRVEALRQQRDAANTALTEAKVALAGEEQLANSFRSQQQPLENRISELTQLAEQRKREIATVIERKGQADREIVESRGRIEALQHEREQVSTQTADLLGERDAQAANISGREETLRERRRRLEQCQQQRGTIEVEIAQREMSVQNLRERIQQKYHVILDDIRSECINITFADEGPARIVTLTPEEMAASGAATDWDAVAQQVEALQKRLEEMGPVNLVAIEEYEETEQRHQFLTKQYDDLVSAKTQLVEVINRINVQTREMFTSTFNQIRDNFRTMFSEVFGGGKADLVLLDEGDVLESGIDIVARPPGKQLQTISLLSGGEQTMTAVALLFSIYQVKPSPFCVLDELDAPLDESNINRFVRVLQRFLEQSQFIVITHNKRTIGMADVLYGVTMEEHGVSKIVSVKFHKAADQVIEHRPQRAAPLVPLPPEPAVEDEEDAPHKREDTLEVVMAK